MQKIVGYTDELKLLTYAAETNKAVLMEGETGLGKTALVRYLAQRNNKRFRRLNLNGQTTTDEFVGKILIDKKGTYWQDGVLIEAMREGYWLLLDEINAALPEVLFVLQSLLDDDRFVVLSENDGETVTPHKDFRLFATMNPSGKYAGTKQLNAAFLSRFPIVMKLEYPQPDQELKIIRNYSDLAPKTIKVLVKMANDLRKAYFKNEIDLICSTRDLINTAIIAKDLGIKKAVQISILNRANEDDYKAVNSVTSLYFGKSGMMKLVDYEKELKKLTDEHNELKQNVAKVKADLVNYNIQVMQTITTEISNTTDDGKRVFLRNIYQVLERNNNSWGDLNV